MTLRESDGTRTTVRPTTQSVCSAQLVLSELPGRRPPPAARAALAARVGALARAMVGRDHPSGGGDDELETEVLPPLVLMARERAAERRAAAVGALAALAPYLRPACRESLLLSLLATALQDDAVVVRLAATAAADTLLRCMATQAHAHGGGGGRERASSGEIGSANGGGGCGGGSRAIARERARRCVMRVTEMLVDALAEEADATVARAVRRRLVPAAYALAARARRLWGADGLLPLGAAALRATLELDGHAVAATAPPGSTGGAGGGVGGLGGSVDASGGGVESASPRRSRGLASSGCGRVLIVTKSDQIF